jgi:hypothetical protein
MHYLYATKKNLPPKLVATFDSEPALRSYVRWATLKSLGEQRGKFEQGSVLAGYEEWSQSDLPLTDEDASQVVHTPTPNML